MSNPCVFASRVFKQTAALAGSVFERADIAAEAWDTPGQYPEREILDSRRELWRLTNLWSHRLPRGGLFGVVKRAERLGQRLWHFRDRRVSVVTAHSIAALPRAVALKFMLRSRLVYDAHELETETNGLEPQLQRRFRSVEAALIPHCDAVVCVGDRIADWYAKRYVIARPAVVRNIPEDETGASEAPVVDLRGLLSIAPSAILFIYQGGLFPGRRIEQLLRVFSSLGDAHHIVFLGYGELESQVREVAARVRNIHLRPAVHPRDVLAYTRAADVGLVGMDNVSLSNFYSLPNKFFEYVRAGIPCVVPDFPEMAALIREGGAGWIAGESDDDWRRAILSVTSERIQDARGAVRQLGDRLRWSSEAEVLRDAYRRVLSAH